MNARTRISLVALLACSLAITRQAFASPPLLVPQPAPGRLNLFSIHMVTPTTGWGATRAAVVHTSDGGRHWQPVTPPIAHFGFPGAGIALDPIDAATAWLAGASARNQFGFTAITVFHTASAGRAWRRLATIQVGLYVDIGDLQFVDPQHGWLVVTRDAGMSQLSFEIYRTSDGGARWSRILREGPMFPNETRSGLLPSCDCMQAYRFVSPTAGWAGACSCALTPGLDQLYRTADGGRSWRAYPLLLPPGRHFDAVSVGAPVFFGARAAVLPVYLLRTQGGSFFDEYRSTDGGRTWTGSTPIPVKVQDDPAAFPDAQYAVLQDGQTIYRTADAGRTWHTTRSTLPRDNLMQLDFLTPSLGFALEGIGATDNTRLLRTTDGGITWDTVPTNA